MRKPVDPSDFADVTTDVTGDAPTVGSASYSLRVAAGPDAGRVFPLDVEAASPTLIGQSPACQVRLTDRRVSRRHASIDVRDGRARLVDLGSTNGTVVQGLQVTDVFLAGGETVRVGDTTLVVDRTTAPRAPRASASTLEKLGRYIGASPEIRRIYPLAELLAVSNVPVVIEGETGTGKEILAEAIHEQGPRASGPFVVFDCTAVPPNLLESELFGHERGAFTTAVATRKGVFEQAHGGTLLIDEIGDLDLALQPKLLRVLERGEVRRVGGDKPIQVDVRILAATRRDLDREVQAGRFRDDLFHRLAVARIELPPLRTRRGDVRLLANHFWRELGGGSRPIPPDVLVRWEDARWPGNVRELRNSVARLLALGELGLEPPSSRGQALSSDDFFQSVITSGVALPMARMRVVNELERRYIAHVLEQHGGHVGKAAAASGVARRYFQLLRGRSK